MIEECLRLIENLIRLGTVDSVDTNTVIIRWPSGLKSRPMGWMTSSSSLSATPAVGDQACVLCPGGRPENAVALCGNSVTDAARGDKAPAARADLTKAELDGIKSDLDTLLTHTHPYTSPSGPATTSVMTQTLSYEPTEPAAEFVEVD